MFGQNARRYRCSDWGSIFNGIEISVSTLSNCLGGTVEECGKFKRRYQRIGGKFVWVGQFYGVMQKLSDVACVSYYKFFKETLIMHNPSSTQG